MIEKNKDDKEMVDNWKKSINNTNTSKNEKHTLDWINFIDLIRKIYKFFYSF